MRGRVGQLPLPPHFDAANAGRWEYAPNQAMVFESAVQWRRQYEIAPAAESTFNLHLLLIDCQKDFCFPGGALYVGGRSGNGALADNRRIAELIYRNLAVIKNVTATMDSHFAFQIFFASFWVDGDGAPLAPYRTVTAADIGGGAARPNPTLAWWAAGGDYAGLRRQVQYYCDELERVGKYQLYLWPPHCIVGSDGHPLVGVIHEARLFHSYVRGTQTWVVMKGRHPLTENYSVIRPEILTRHEGGELAERNEGFLRTLLAADALVIVGQAASHCVKSTIDDLLDEIVAHDPSLARKVYVVEDCMSAVALPDGRGGFIADFTNEAAAALSRYAEAGMHIVRSTDPMVTWPGIPI